jgi:eukaryotic-like serine/threonine-protein kinase
MRKVPILLFIILLILVIISERKTPYKLWKFETSGPILSHPFLDRDVIYFGNDDQKFYAVDTDTRKELWSVSTMGSCRSQPLINGNVIYFQSGRSVYALDKQTGETIWDHHYERGASNDPLDPWDYHHGAPRIIGDDIYFGLEDGNLYGFDLLSGEKRDQFTSIDSAAIRCTPAVSSDIIYFGDWNGRVYAYDTQRGDTLWTYKTYKEKLYPTFGQLNAEFVVYDSLLIFGARNPELQILNLKTGQPVWNYISAEGGWVSGDPIVLHDTLYIAGSDNHKFFAFDVHTGEKFWEFEFLFNNFSKPLIIQDQILFTTGDAGTAYRNDEGYGYVYSIDRLDGKILNIAYMGCVESDQFGVWSQTNSVHLI